MSGLKGLIDAAALAARLVAGDVAVLDVRTGANGAGRAAFEAGHIPGARHTDYAADGWRQKRGGAPGLLPDAGHLAALFARLDLAPGMNVVVVPAGESANDLAGAARVYWTLKTAGFSSLALLDGGTKGWIAAGHAVETGPPAHRPAPEAALTFNWRARAHAGDVLAAVETGGAALVDGRSASYFRGAEKAPEALSAGRIPGARHVDYVAAFDAAASRLKSLPELTALYAGLPAAGPVISYCNTGHTAALNWFALSEVMGRAGVRLYDGSMTEWTQDPARPVVTGE